MLDGGSINYQVWFRGHRLDYDGRAAAGMRGWGWDDVLPSFRRSENHELGASDLHGTGGPVPVTTPKDVSPLSPAFITAGVESGLPLDRDFNGAELDGAGLVYSNIRDGERVRASRAYLHSAMDRPNLDVRTEAQVTRVLLDGKRATGVEYRRGGSTRRVYADSVVLCAGAVRTPQVLMLSGTGPADHLADLGIAVVHDLPCVGGGLQDHPSAVVSWPVTRGETWSDALSEGNRALYDERRGPLASVGQASAFLRVTHVHRLVQPPGRHLPGGGGRRGGRRCPAARARCGGTARRGRLGDAEPPALEHPRPYGHDRRAGGRTPALDLDTGLRQPGGGPFGTAERPPRVGPANLPCGACVGSQGVCAVRSASGFGPVIAGSRG
ncbi:GMC family oxidoreductase [Streptomyces rubiginosohelvolus]|uniref:GMC family oxidoreductase n=1 Tax=Streptomyces rubiginosohelvolus TaxID=67362 RepID=UPI003F4D9E4E